MRLSAGDRARDPGRLLALAALLVLLGSSGTSRAGAVPRIAVLVSQDAPPYEQALAGFRRSLGREGPAAALDVYPLRGDPAAAAAALGRARQDQVHLILTLGSIATRAAVREVADLPIVAGLILTQDDLERTPNATGVVLEFPVEIELRWLQKILPGQKNVGVLFSPSENQVRIDAATRAAQSLGLTLQARRVTTPRELPEALDSLARRADVLWGVPDQIVLNPQTVKTILLFSLRNRIPFVGLSETWVKAGALYALDRDYADLGAQCAEMAAKILQGRPPRALPPVSPRKVLYSVNLKTARLLKLDLREDLVQSAQEVIN
jgi:putative ABC transport system substrate-binding protein